MDPFVCCDKGVAVEAFWLLEVVLVPDVDRSCSIELLDVSDAV